MVISDKKLKRLGITREEYEQLLYEVAFLMRGLAASRFAMNQVPSLFARKFGRK